ncbi:hypothetical protein [Algibacter sp. PT7-4]|uniref:hypothetical protein n=1 Tax=Algibacter ulvanivorans TaxID=3400999 RepID=UPI003AB07455
MELVLSTKKVKNVTKQKEDLINKPSGFLTSRYKQVVKSNFKANKAASIFNLRQQIKSRGYATSCIMETSLKLSVFLTAILLIFN